MRCHDTNALAPEHSSRGSSVSGRPLADRSPSPSASLAASIDTPHRRCLRCGCATSRRPKFLSAPSRPTGRCLAAARQSARTWVWYRAQLLKFLDDGVPVQGGVARGQLLRIVGLEAAEELTEFDPLIARACCLHHMAHEFLRVVDAVRKVLDDFLGVLVSVDQVVCVATLEKRCIQGIAAAPHVPVPAATRTVE